MVVRVSGPHERRTFSCPHLTVQENLDLYADLRGDAPEARPRYNLVATRPACPSCGHMITAVENVPVLSWLTLRGVMLCSLL